MILAAVLIVPLVAFLLWWAFGPDDEWYIDDQDEYVVTSLFSYKKDVTK